MSFYLNFTPPSLGIDLKLKEMGFGHYRILNKFLINNNNFHITEYFDKILLDCLEEKDAITSLSNFDKFCGLFLLRCACISPEIEFNVGPSPKKALLLPLLKKSLDAKTTFSKKVVINEDIEISITLPKILYFETQFDALYDSIDEVFFKDKKVIFNNKKELIDTLPAHVLTHLKDFSKQVEKDFNPIVLDVGINEKDKFSLSPYNLSLLEILKALYSTNLKSIIELQYILVSKCRYSADYIDKNTLAENLIIANIYEAEMKRINEEQNKAMEKPGLGNK